MSEQTGEISFMVTTGFGARERQPYVQVLIEAADFMTQMPPASARELASNLLEAAEAAEGDGFLIGFLEERIGIDNDGVIVSMLMQFREYREAQRKGGDDDAG